VHPGYYLPNDVAGTTQADVLLSVTPPPQMPATMEAGTIDGYSVGEPWNQAAVVKKIGVAVIADHDIFAYNPEKVLGLSRKFADANPKTVHALVRAIIKAQMWLDAEQGGNRAEAVKILARSHYVGADEQVIARSMTGSFTYAPGDTRAAPDFNIFFGHYAGYPYYSDAVWILSQMRRWGQIAEAKPDAWYAETAARVYRPELYLAAAQSLVSEGKARAEDFPDTDGYRPPQDGFIDGKVYDGKAPNAYLDGFAIGLHSGQVVTAAGAQ
jgi:nitrate/nitrite transport system substrate-binding protein